jgi:hypothetical protein
LKLQKITNHPNLFEDLLGGPYSKPDFVKADEIEAETAEAVENRGQNTASIMLLKITENSFIE